MLNNDLSYSEFSDNFYAQVIAESTRKNELKQEHISEFVSRLAKLLPQVGSDEDKIVQIEVLVALSVEGILTVDNMAEKMPMVKAICEMIKFDKEKKESVFALAKRLLG